MMDSIKSEEIKKYYSVWWENPRDIRNVVFERLNEYVRQRMPPGSGRKALDIGSGHGRIVSYLLEKGYEVTAVEFNEEFVAELKNKFPNIQVISEDVSNIEVKERFNVITCIELVQNLDAAELSTLLSKLAGITSLLLVNMSNRNSLHSRWVELRGWTNSFVFNYTPREFEQILEESGFEIVHRRGIGLLTPVSLFKDFRVKLIPSGLAKAVNNLDGYMSKVCHLYYVEAISQRL